MKVTAFSDTHGHHRKVVLPKSDLFIFAGDAMTCGYKEQELKDFIEWYDAQPAKYKIMVAGNHDRYIENNRGLFQDMLQGTGIVYLQDRATVIDGLTIYGTPHSKKFCNWAFNRTESELEKLFSRIDFDVDILVSHAPQFGVLDMLERGERVGEPALSKQFDRFTQIRKHIFGHIHCQYGEQDCGTHTALNVSLVNEQYEMVNQPVTFKIYPHG